MKCEANMSIIYKYIIAGLFSSVVLLAASCTAVSLSGSGGGSSGKKYALHPLGAKFDTFDKPGISAKSPGKLSGALSSSVNLNSSFWPPVGDQGDLGACVPFAVGYYLLTYLVSSSTNNLLLWNPANAANQFSPAWIYNQINSGVDGGSFPSDAFNLITLKGCDTYADFPYYGYVDSSITNLPGAVSYAYAANFAQKSWSFVNQNVNAIKSFLTAGQPVVIGIMVFTPDFDLIGTGNPITGDVYSTTNAYTNVMIDGQYWTSFYRGGHCVCLIGYDDSKQCTDNGTPTSTGAFLFVNQWTTQFGDSGYGWISYAFVNSIIQEALTFN